MEVYVVTNVEDGWDCVRGVFSSLRSLKDFFEEMSDLEENSTGWDHYQLLDSVDKLENFLHNNGHRTECYVIHTETIQ